MSDDPFYDHEAAIEHRLTIFRDVAEEREHQAAKFPEDERELDLFVGLAMLGEEKGECDRAALEARFALLEGRYDEQIHARSLRTELLHTAAVAVKLLEILDRGGLVVGDRSAEIEDRPDADLPSPISGAVPWCVLCRVAMRHFQSDPRAFYICPHCGAVPEAATEITGDPS